MITFVPVVDISRNQGAVDFVKMKAAGVRGLILRVGNGNVVDDHFEGYWQGALAAGYTPEDLTVYSFINPKRGTGPVCAVAMLDEIHRVVGHLDVGYMADCEWYTDQSPTPGQAPVYGLSYGAWLREHRSTIATEAPHARFFGYTDLAFWNGPIFKGSPDVWCGDDQLASEIDWIVPRYPAYSDAAYAHYGYPGAADTWADWAFKAQPDGPLPPRGGTWVGWQPSAGWNRQGDTYGASSRDLDLDIVQPDAWARWTGTAPKPQPPQPLLEDDMPQNYYIVTGANAKFVGTPVSVRWTGPGDAKVEAAINTQLSTSPPNLVPVDLTGGPAAFAATFLEGDLPVGDTLHTWTGDEFANSAEIKARTVSMVDLGARDAIARLGQTVGDMQVGAQRMADAGKG